MAGGAREPRSAGGRAARRAARISLRRASERLLQTRDVIERRLAAAGTRESWVGKTIGPYRVIAPLGQGGMGSVWLAERADGLFSRRVALKLVHRSLEAAATERFARERQILAGLDHPHIARLLDAGFTGDGQPYLALWQASVARDNAVAAQREATKAKVVQASSSIFSA